MLLSQMPAGIFEFEFIPMFENPFQLFALKCVNKEINAAFSKREEILVKIATSNLADAEEKLAAADLRNIEEVKTELDAVEGRLLNEGRALTELCSLANPPARVG
jgi:hypothetical protein